MASVANLLPKTCVKMKKLGVAEGYAWPVPVADPGFPVGGVNLAGGAWTPEAVAFQKFCMSKRKNLDPWGVGACAGNAHSRSANADDPSESTNRQFNCKTYFANYLTHSTTATTKKFSWAHS